MSKPQKKIQLFNCDHIYELRVVADFLNETKQKHGFDFSVEEHYFSLPQISELSEKIIPELKMDLAVFVVHAHESRLAINEDDCGYTKVYRALLRATGSNVIIVIGGDDSYKDEDEEDREFISRSVRRKIYLQFSDEFMDGRKSFIFSWDKKHREIHEKALLHFFDPHKKGLKFEYPPSKPKLSLGATPPHVRPSEPEASSKPSSSLPERPYAGEQFQSTKPVISVQSRARRISDHGARPKEKRSSSTETKGLSVLGWNANLESLSAATQLIHKNRDILNLHTDPDVLNLAVKDMISYLENNPVKYCVLIVDAEKFKTAREQERGDDYLGLLQTAERSVEEKIIITVCCPRSLSKNDVLIVNRTIAEAFNDNSKVYVTWFVNGKLALNPDDFVMLLTSNITKPCSQKQTFASQTSSFEKIQLDYGQENAASGSSPDFGHNPHGIDLKNYKIFLPTGKTVMVLTRLRNGNISRQPEDVEYWMPGFDVPGEIEDYLLIKNSKKSNVELVILLNEKGVYTTQVDKKREKEWQQWILLAPDETVVLQTHLRYGQISFEEKDVVIRYPNWRPSQDEILRLEQKYKGTCNADLFVISDEKGTVRCIVQMGSKREVFSFINKTVRTKTVI